MSLGKFLEEYRWFFLIIVVIFGIAALANSLLGEPPERYTSLESVSPTGGIPADEDAYRFANYKGKILYGPYHVNDGRYFYHDGEVLNQALEQEENQKVRNLHSFYMKTYLDPLFYTPNGEDINLTRFEKFEDEKILAKECNLEYDVIPEEFFSTLENNVEKTDSFYERPSLKKARELTKSNYETSAEYGSMASIFIGNIDKDVSGNECFGNDTENDISQVTTTPDIFEIDEEVLKSYGELGTDNADKLLKEINRRGSILEGNRSYRIEEVESDQRLENATYNHQDVLNPSQAREVFNKRRKDEFVKKRMDRPNSSFSNLDDSERQEALLAEETPRKFNVKTHCMDEEYLPIYGWEKKFYPNLISGKPVIQGESSPFTQDFFTVCRCPYVELTRLNWQVNQDMYEEISDFRFGSSSYDGDNSERVSESEDYFVTNPGDENRKQMSREYRKALIMNLKSGDFDQDIPRLWKRTTMERSKIKAYEATYEDFYNKRHMEVWSEYFPLDERERPLERSAYNYFFLVESMYAINFMTYSDSVWRIEEKPLKYSDEIDFERFQDENDLNPYA